MLVGTSRQFHSERDCIASRSKDQFLTGVNADFDSYLQLRFEGTAFVDWKCRDTGITVSLPNPAACIEY